jgi:hypothetical protein
MVKAPTNVAISNIDTKFWAYCEDHDIRVGDKYWKKEGLWVIQQKVVINLFDLSESE